ncbi:efflux transporter outer membrane subunit [Sphingomonas faeni]|uniref:efflux transporter outer membrane subunit n=1 Tax=Sphingomonas faeni TaxID=185950 RepID=UPI0027855007|nr:efflux transporter outer membrane subunit [Sphingomonas faeni]MDQ0839313.1 multidrug efflux system outer membrane protein [Sphingomonas faeni]
MRRRLTSLPLIWMLAGCDLAPHYLRPELPVPSSWPAGDAYPVSKGETAGLPWRSVVTDSRLRSIIELALANNQNLAATVANVAAARAQYRGQRAAQFPEFGASVSSTVDRPSTATDRSNLSAASIGISSFGIDLFDKQRNLSKAAFQQYLATYAGMRSTRILLIAETASAFVTYASDRELLAIAQLTVASGTRALELTKSLHRSGLVAGSDVADAETIVAQAQSDVAQFTTQLAKDRNAIELLVGFPPSDQQLEVSLKAFDASIALVPPGLSSAVLLQRPDVVQAEHVLQGTTANIGVARAAFFPTISLTAALGFASATLGALFTGGAFGMNNSAGVSMPILGGPTRGNLEYARAQRDQSLANYRHVVQTAFREVADALARRGTIYRQREAQARLVAAASTSYRLAEARYRTGTATFLSALVAQRTLYAAQQTQCATVLADLQNRIDLYQYIGADGGA